MKKLFLPLIACFSFSANPDIIEEPPLPDDDCDIHQPIFSGNGAPSSNLVYQTSTQSQLHLIDPAFETGNQIQLAGTARLLTLFSVSYVVGPTNLAPTARLRFYRDDPFSGFAGGANSIVAPQIQSRPQPQSNDPKLKPQSSNTPGSLLYDSGDLKITPGSGVVTVSNLLVAVNSGRFIWTIQFGGIAPNDRQTSLIEGSPRIGSSTGFYWQKRGNQWLWVSAPAKSNQFHARAIAAEQLRIFQISSGGMFGVVRASGAIEGKQYTLESKLSPSDNAPWKLESTCGRQEGGGIIQFDSFGTFGKSGFFRVVERDPEPRGGE